MTDEMRNNQELPEIPDAVSEPRRRYAIQLVWIIPIVAAIIGLSLAVKSFMERGEMITITFNSGEGMEAGKTKIKYKDVQIGEVKGLAISKDRSHVIVTAEIARDARGLLVKDTRFWVVRARISGGNVTGLGTLIGGSYIGVDAGTSKERRDHFAGLESPPAVSLNVPGRQFRLHAEDLGSVDTGAPIFFRRVQVGQVTSTELDQNGNGVTIKVFVRAPFDKYVKSNSIFWQASGVDVTLNPNGLKVNTESMVAILLGGISFYTPDSNNDAPLAKPEKDFPLYGTRDEAMKHAEIGQPFQLVFSESVRGLAIGAPVEIAGVTVGEVTKVDVTMNPQRSGYVVPVGIQFFPERLHALQNGGGSQNLRQMLDSMVAHGLRAEIKSGSLLTGQLYVSLDFAPKAKPAHINWNSSPPTFPTVPGSMQELQKSLARIVKKIENLPLQELAGDARKTVKSLDETLRSADRLLKNVDASLIPEAKGALTDARQSLDELRKTLGSAQKTMGGANEVLSPEAPLQVDLRDTLREVSRAAQSLRMLGDYLEQHPESLIRGKRGDSK
jgi:paraquat-inducible protein B